MSLTMMIDWWAIAALAIGGVSLALRGYFLKPEYKTWVTAPRAVSLSLVVLALVMVARLISINGGSHATAGEAVVYSAHAVTATVMLANLVRQRPPHGLIGALLEQADEAARAVIERTLRAVGLHPGDRK